MFCRLPESRKKDMHAQSYQEILHCAECLRLHLDQRLLRMNEIDNVLQRLDTEPQQLPHQRDRSWAMRNEMLQNQLQISQQRSVHQPEHQTRSQEFLF